MHNNVYLKICMIGLVKSITCINHKLNTQTNYMRFNLVRTITLNNGTNLISLIFIAKLID